MTAVDYDTLIPNNVTMPVEGQHDGTETAGQRPPTPGGNAVDLRHSPMRALYVKGDIPAQLNQDKR